MVELFAYLHSSASSVCFFLSNSPEQFFSVSGKYQIWLQMWKKEAFDLFIVNIVDGLMLVLFTLNKPFEMQISWDFISFFLSNHVNLVHPINSTLWAAEKKPMAWRIFWRSGIYELLPFNSITSFHRSDNWFKTCFSRRYFLNVPNQIFDSKYLSRNDVQHSTSN